VGVPVTAAAPWTLPLATSSAANRLVVRCLVVVRYGRAGPRHRRMEGLGPAQRLDLGFLIAAEQDSCWP
jgi:hypothetical protein